MELNNKFMLSLAKTHLNSYSPIVRQKGRQLFQAGRCQIQKSEPGLVRGRCQESGTKYMVGGRVQGNNLHVHCECPVFEAGNGFCQHLYALLLTVDQRGISAYLSPDTASEDESGESKLVADEMWVEKKENSLVTDESNSWRALVNNVERIRQSQEKMLFKADISYILNFSKDPSGKLLMELTLHVKAADMAEEEGNPFYNVSLERMLHIVKQNDFQIFSLILANTGADPLGAERKFRLPTSVEPKLAELLDKVPCQVAYDGVPVGAFENDSETPFELIMRVEDMSTHSILRPLLTRNGEELKMENIKCFITSYPRGFYTDNIRHRLKENVDPIWIQAIEVGSSAYHIPVASIRDFLTHFAKACTHLHPRVEWPENFWTHIDLEAEPTAAMQMEFNELGVSAELFFEYPMDPPQRISAFSAQSQVLQWGTRKSCDRNKELEQKFIEDIEQIPNLEFLEEEHSFNIDHEHVQDVLKTLQEKNVLLFGKDRKIKTYSRANLEITTKIDWFEVKGQIEFDGGANASLGDMLEAIRNNSRFVLLSNGEYGLLPDQWIARNRHLLEIASAEGENLQVKQHQFLLLQQMAEDQTQGVTIKNNAGLKHLNELVSSADRFGGIDEAEQPKEFKGEMRQYQLTGLSWLRFLKRFHFGGILADDMGLGKTIQAIASLLEEVKAARKTKGKGKSKSKTDFKPNLIILPTSLVFNWNDELTRFAPNLKVVSYMGSERGELEAVMKSDIVLTTYGILRRQAEEFSAVQWNYIILDEAQAIKNHKSQIATAVCSLNGEHRLSLTGTPIENNLMELWSHMEFLNPSLLGNRDQFAKYLVRPEKEGEKNEQIQRLQKLVYPFILRRTKEDVLTDLPEKIEQITYCSMGTRQTEFYNSRKELIRNNLFDSIKNRGIPNARLRIIEGLLMLRKIACHPCLVDRNISIPSTKLKHLMSSLLEVISEGHKVLVFSQFTSMLELVVREFTKENIRFTYLDGQTRDRQERVKAFQSDPSLQVFLISLKAGGVGLNLTAADYVFLYDPWWNPAAEMQAIDRAHRIGQTKKVFTYRLITKDTVEEKVLELQAHKKDLVKGVIGAEDGDIVKSLSKKDLEYLFT